MKELELAEALTARLKEHRLNVKVRTKRAKQQRLALVAKKRRDESGNGRWTPPNR